MRNALLAARGPEWSLMLRQKNSIDRQIERKIKGFVSWGLEVLPESWSLFSSVITMCG
jgi:hypothetical protein